MFTFILILLVLGVFIYFYVTKPTFRTWVEKSVVWVIAAATAAGAAIATWWHLLPGT